MFTRRSNGRFSNRVQRPPDTSKYVTSVIGSGKRVLNIYWDPKTKEFVMEVED